MPILASERNTGVTTQKTVLILSLIILFVIRIADVKADPTTVVPGYVTHNTIEGNVGSQATGVIGMNMAAGDFNVQANMASVALSVQRGKGIAQINSFQSASANGGNAPDVSTVGIHDNAFANVRGMVSINQASGVANVQANGVALAVGVNAKAVAETDLAQVASPAGITPAVTNAGRGIRQITVDDTAFRNARGLIQVNQSAGVGNATANSFSLRFQTQGAR